MTNKNNKKPNDKNSKKDVGLADDNLLAKVINLTKRRGFVFPSADIYGGFRSAYDFGPVGVLLLRNVKETWWYSMVQTRDEVVGLDASILSPPAIWEASGHLENFTDPLVDCKACGVRHRHDQLEDKDTCPDCGKKGEMTEPRQFNLMFKTSAGPVADSGADVYLRPETAQGMFINYGLVANASRKKPPFGIAQIGKSFRNEITPGNFIFRTREFEQMEMEYFVPPEESPKWHKYWCEERLNWYINLGIPKDMLQLREHGPDERSHYSDATSDVEFKYPWGWGELEGIANRTDFDLSQHAKHSGKKLEHLDSETGEKYIPHVIEPAAGATRAMMAFLIAAYDEEEVKGEKRTVLRLDWRLAPYKAAVLPLSKKPELSKKAKEVLELLQPLYMVDFDETQSIGKRYRRQDELGTPFCITVDFESLDDDAVTVRDRDSMEQDRVTTKDLVKYLAEHLKNQ